MLATREINVLPPPLSDIPLMDPRPQKVMRFEPPAKEEITNKEKTLSEYKRHWKRVKKKFVNLLLYLLIEAFLTNIIEQKLEM